jgi:hypothetical protein
LRDGQWGKKRGEKLAKVERQKTWRRGWDKVNGNVKEWNQKAVRIGKRAENEQIKQEILKSQSLPTIVFSDY